ncbi:LPXTG cell wall anchor domain-containing protein [Enterococcus sp. DIV0086]|uniref:LPXTG cell wall anchor domain-containing protein n=1 Tax=Enterococcus sp. DIV0086 TaxID=2774655 RepID=UPI003D2DD8E7
MKHLIYGFSLIIGLGLFGGYFDQKEVFAAPSQTEVAIKIKEAPPVVPNANQLIPIDISDTSIRGDPDSNKGMGYSKYPQTNEDRSPWWVIPLGMLISIGTLLFFIIKKKKRGNIV